MPELPDVETMRRYLTAEALGRRVADIEVRDRRTLRDLPPRELAEAVSGKPLTVTARHGKWLFAEVGRGPWIVMHFRMTGSLAVTPPGAPPSRFARVRFRFADGGALEFRDQRRFGLIVLADDPAAFAAAHRLGPDALDPRLTAAAFEERLSKRHGPLKTVLLDQAFVAGIGNVYGDEVCHAAGLAPLSRVEDLSPKERRAVYRAMRGVLDTAVKRMTEGRPFPNGWLIDERRAGGVCPRCGEPVSRAKLQARYTYWCACSQTMA